MTEANEEAVAWIDKWPDWRGRSLLVVGPPGSGKTHLANVWQAQTNAQLVSSDEIAALAIDKLEQLSEGPLILENAGHGMDETALFHLFNLMAEKQSGLLITARKTPRHWNLQLADLISRLGTIPVATIHEPDDALFAALVIKLFSDRQLAVTPDVVQYIVDRLERSFEAARRFVAHLDHRALAGKRKITLPLIRDVFKEEQG